MRETELIKAATKGLLQKLREMVWEGNINDASVSTNALKNGRTLLHCATLASTADAECVSFLLGCGAAVDAVTESGETPLHWAATGRRADVLALLVEHGADVAVANADGDTAIHLCIEGRDVHSQRTNTKRTRGDGDDDDAVRCVSTLLDGGAPVDVVNLAGYTPLLWAAHKEHTEMVRLLLDSGADVSAADAHGCTALHWAAISRTDDTILLCVIINHAGTRNLDVRDTLGNTPLHLAALHNCARCAQLLLDRHASRDVLNDKAETPLMVAQHCGSDVCARVLMDVTPMTPAPPAMIAVTAADLVV